MRACCAFAYAYALVHGYTSPGDRTLSPSLSRIHLAVLKCTHLLVEYISTSRATPLGRLYRVQAYRFVAIPLRFPEISLLGHPARSFPPSTTRGLPGEGEDGQGSADPIGHCTSDFSNNFNRGKDLRFPRSAVDCRTGPRLTSESRAIS